jgi:hypothetical protein
VNRRTARRCVSYSLTSHARVYPLLSRLARKTVVLRTLWCGWTDGVDQVPSFTWPSFGRARACRMAVSMHVSRILASGRYSECSKRQELQLIDAENIGVWTDGDVLKRWPCWSTMSVRCLEIEFMHDDLRDEEVIRASIAFRVSLMRGIFKMSRFSKKLCCFERLL